MRYRVFRRRIGWVVQLWDGCSWRDVTRVYSEEARAVKVKELLECAE